MKLLSLAITDLRSLGRRRPDDQKTECGLRRDGRKNHKGNAHVRGEQASALAALCIVFCRAATSVIAPLYATLRH